MKAMLRYFMGSFVVTAIGLIAAFFLGHLLTGTLKGAFTTVFLCAVLGILEVSLSFDNAVVNAAVLRSMTPLWRRRFLTWGIVIAVFGMRILFPLLIVGIVASINPWEALVLAATKPDEYAGIMLAAHIPVAAFGGTFLLMVALRYFFDTRKDIHWIRMIEEPLSKLGKLYGFEIAIAVGIIYLISLKLAAPDALTFMTSGIFGLITFILVDGIASFLEGGEHGISAQDVHRASAGMFLYLEVLDASFSFDGVIGAFAITNNLFLIAIGLGIGAMFVRSLTVLMVDKGTLNRYAFIEHGAFYAIGALAGIMFVNTFVHVHEAVTGLVGAGFIGLSLISSIRHNRRVPAPAKI